MEEWRRRLELRTGPLVVVLARLPRAVPAVLVAVLLLAGLSLGGAAGGVLLLVLALALATLLVLSWPLLAPGARGLRLAVLFLLVARAVLSITGWK